MVRESLSGRPLDTLRDCVQLPITADAGNDGGGGGGGESGGEGGGEGAAGPEVRDVASLCAWLHATHAARQQSGGGAAAAALLCAPAAAGKSCLVSQLVRDLPLVSTMVSP